MLKTKIKHLLKLKKISKVKVPKSKVSKPKKFTKEF